MSVISMLNNLTHRTSSKDYFGHLSEVQAPYLICEKQRRFSYLIFHRTVVFQQGNKLNNMAEKSILFYFFNIHKDILQQCCVTLGPRQIDTATHCICHSPKFLGSGYNFHTQ